MSSICNIFKCCYSSSHLFFPSEEELRNWREEGPLGPFVNENRQEAVKKILACIGNQEERLDLSGLGLSSLPPDIFSHLQHLKELDLSNNRFQAFPYEMRLPKLEKLDLSHNLLTKLPETMEGLSLIQLREINLNNNKLTTVPPLIRNLPHLKIVDFKNNEIEGFNVPGIRIE